MAFGTDDGNPRSYWRRNGWTIAILILCIALSAFFRVAFNYGPATEGGYRYAGNDDYYHLRVVDYVQAEGSHLVIDPLLNYPLTGLNPRPALFDWHAAILGEFVSMFTGIEPSEGGHYALEWGSALWGILLVIPVWLIGRAVFSNAAGLWAGFLIAASPANIQRSGFGLGDHDAFILFFLVLGCYFLVRSFQSVKREKTIADFRNVRSILDGLSEYVSAQPAQLVYAFLAGVSWATIALMWEGFAYVLAIFALFYVLLLTANHIRRRDSTGDILTMVVLMSTIIGMSMPFYLIQGNISNTINTAIYISIALVVVSLATGATRDLPWLIVLPSLAGIGILGVLLLVFVFPDIGTLIFSGSGYFIRTKLYSTIAEAQRTDLGVFVFSTGFMTWFLGIIGFFFGLSRLFRRGERAILFLVAWAFVAWYMAFAATRFVYNASPVFALLAGWTTARFVARMDLRTSRRNWQSMRSESIPKAFRASLSGKVVAGVLFLVITLLLPNIWFSVDAGIPGEFRARMRENHPGARDLFESRTGAFGQGFLSRDWIEVYGWLEGEDATDFDGNPLAPAERPGHMAWWDYGFWEVALGGHPTVSDNFQNGYQMSGRFLAAQSEREAINLMSIRLLEGHSQLSGGTLTEPVRDYIDSVSPGLAAELQSLLNPGGYDQATATLGAILDNLTADQEATIGFYEEVSRLTDTRIGYFLTDTRMLPFDDPNTPYIESGSIFYAPMFLADKNPDDFVQTVYKAQTGATYFVKAYERDADGVVQALRPPKIVDATGREYFVSGNLIYRATPDGERIDYDFNQGLGLPVQSTALEYKDPFYQTMYYRGFVGGDKPVFGNFPQEGFRPGEGLEHFRLVHQASSVKLLKYYPGAVVTGMVRDQSGSPLAGVNVRAYDNFGVGHDDAITDANGTYRILAPFGIPDENGTLQMTSIRVLQGSAAMAEQQLEITEAQAYRIGDYNFTVDFDIAPGNVTGFAYLDRDRNGAYDASIDEVGSGASASIVGGASTTADSGGNFTLSGVPAGQHTLTVTGPAGYRPGNQSVSVTTGQTATVSVGLRASDISVTGNISQPGAAAVPGYEVVFTATNPDTEFTTNRTVTASAAGVFTGALPPGTYQVSVDHATIENGQSVRYAGQATVTLTLGQAPMTFTALTLNITRTEQ